MLTTTSGINNVTGYQAQLNISNSVRPSETKERSSSSRKEQSDTVNISSEARALQHTYQIKETTLEQNYNNDAQQLEQKYLQEQNILESEFRIKKQSLELNIVA